MMSYMNLIKEEQALPLNHTELGQFKLFETPLWDKDQIKRVVLFSDNPLNPINFQEESLFMPEFLDIQVCDSEHTRVPFDLAKLQSDPIFIKDKERMNNPQNLFEIVASVQYLPYPFSFSKLITFQPRYMFVNKTFQTLHIVQNACEDKGLFKVFPLETSVFHWTDAAEPNQISVRLEEYEYSGSFRIDNIGEVNMRLKSSLDKESMILNVSISEESSNTLFIVFTDMSFSPPYRIENLTKATFKISQIQSRAEDFDIIKPFNIIPYGWSYPLQEKLLKISICSQSFSDEELGFYYIDSIDKNESIMLRSKKGKKHQYLLEIINEKFMKVVRIIYAGNANVQDELMKKEQKQSS